MNDVLSHGAVLFHPMRIVPVSTRQQHGGYSVSCEQIGGGHADSDRRSGGRYSVWYNRYNRQILLHADDSSKTMMIVVGMRGCLSWSRPKLIRITDPRIFVFTSLGIRQIDSLIT